MTQRRGLFAAGRFLRHAVLTNLAILAVTGLVCWFGGWRAAGDYANGLVYAGIAVMAVGGLRYFASETGVRDPAAGYYSVNLREHHDRTQQTIAESDSAFVFMLKMGVVGLVPVVLGQLIKAVFA